MKHFLGVQNGSIFVSFLCIFTNFFLVLLRKRTFWWLLLCIFTNRKNCRQRHTNEHFSRLRAGIPSAGNFFSFYSFTRHHTSRRQPANTTTPATSFLTEQISASRSPTTFTFTNPLQLSFLPPSNLPISSSLHHPTLSINLPPKKLSLRLSFSRYI